MSHNLLSPVLELIQLNNQKITTILDIGAGFGRLGINIRYLEDYPHDKDWKFQLTAIEIFPGYIQDLEKLKVYDIIKQEDIRLINYKNYDLVLLIEVLDHLPKLDSLKLINQLKRDNKFIILSLPDGGMVHESVHGNKYQEHLCQFRGKEFRKMGFKTQKVPISEGESVIAYSPELLDVRIPFRRRLFPLWFRKLTIKLLKRL